MTNLVDMVLEGTYSGSLAIDGTFLAPCRRASGQERMGGLN